MIQTQSIIVYRNPVEQAFWEGLMNSTATWPIMVGIGVFIVSFLIFNALIYRVLWGLRSTKIKDHANYALALASVCCVSTIAYLWI
jgi:hypothetical protein